MKQHPVWNIFSHIAVIGSTMFLVFFLIDRVNPAMDFLTSELSKWCLFFFCLSALMTGLCSATYLFKREKKASLRSQAMSRQRRAAHRSACIEF
jgi:predicted membrane channel-forming protein YqfA (hemolysin III family)